MPGIRLSATANRQPWRRSDAPLGLIFLVPSFVIFAVFVFSPLVQTIVLSLYRTSPFGGMGTFAGFDHYADLLTDSKVLDSIRVTVLFVLFTVPATIFGGLALALIAQGSLPGMTLFRTVFSLTISVSVATASVVFLLFFNSSVGLVNIVGRLFGLPAIGWLTDPSWALVSIAVVTIWLGLGFSFIICSSGLSGIPEEVYEAARLDGAGPLTTLTRITLPLLSPTLFFLGVVSTIGAFQAFGQIDIMTRGGPAGATNTLVYTIYREAFVNFQYGRASALAIVLFAIMLALTLIQFRFVESRVHYQ